MTQNTTEKYSAAEWEHLRERFLNSILNDTEIAKLGQNVGVSWPFKGSDETPAKYIRYEFEELNTVPGLIGKKKRVQSLMDILRETLAFDDPFSDMVDAVESESAEDDTFERILAKLKIPMDYPMAFIHISAETIKHLKSQGIDTLIQAIHFGQGLALDAQIGGDLRTFINGLGLIDEASVMQHLPYRRSVGNLHLAEAVGLMARDLDEPVQLELLSQAGVSLSDDQEALRKSATPSSIEASLQITMERFDALCAWFTEEAEELEHICKKGESVERYFIPINESRRECVATTLARAKFGIPKSERRGVLGKLSGLFGH